MKQLLFLVICAGLFTTANAQQLKTPQPSTTQTIKQDFGLGTIEFSYSRPNMKGRKIFGDLVPFNDVWRTGANSATTLTFTDDVTIGGTKIAPGKYGLLSIPSATEWILIITKQTDVTSPAAYKQENDVVRVKVKPVMLPKNVETFTATLANITNTSCDLQLSWEKTLVSLKITTEVDSKVMAQIAEAMKTEKPPYYSAAVYYADNGKDLNQALAWFEKAAEQTPNAYWVHYQRAKALAKAGKKAEAMESSKKSMQLAKEQKNNDYVKLNEKLQKELK